MRENVIESNAYFVASDPDSPVAICTLSSRELNQALVASPLAGKVAIIGPLETENVGIQRMILSLLERPRIRFLVVCGEEARGRYQGQALLALFASGVDAAGLIIGAPGRRARVPSLTPDQLDHVRRQVKIKNLSGSLDLAQIEETVDDCAANDPGPYTEAVTLPVMDTIPIPAQQFRLREHDPVGYFVILPDTAQQQIVIEHYRPDGVLAHRLAGPDAESICVALVEWSLVSRLEHAAYLGRELQKAEFALRRDLRYYQDETLC